MSTVTWVLKDVSGNNLAYQPPSGSPLMLKYKSNGRTYVSGYSSQEIAICECTADVSTVSIDITPDSTTNPPLDEDESNPTQDPGTHDGRYLWQEYSLNHLVLSFTVPETTATVWGWNFGNLPPIALKIKIKVKR